MSSEDTLPNAPLFKRQAWCDPSQTWDHVTWLISISKLPVIVKGITTGEDQLYYPTPTAIFLNTIIFLSKPDTHEHVSVLPRVTEIRLWCLKRLSH